MHSRTWQNIRLTVLLVGIMFQCLGLGVLTAELRSPQFSSSAAEDNIRTQEKLAALNSRVEKIEAAELRVRVSVIEAQINTIRWIAALLLSGVAALLGEAGVRIYVYRAKEPSRARG